MAEGVVSSRSEAVRQGLSQLIDRHRRLATGQAMPAEYRARPQTAEIGWADEETRRMIAEESS